MIVVQLRLLPYKYRAGREHMQTPMTTYGIARIIIVCLVYLSIVLFAFSVHAAELEITDSMTKREYRYGEIPTFTLSFRLEDGSSDTANVEVRFVREDGVSLATTTEMVNIPANETIDRSYPLVVSEWRAGYYYTIAKIVYAGGDTTIVRRVTFSLRPHIVGWWVYGSSGLAIVIGLSIIFYVFLTKRRAQHTVGTKTSTPQANNV